MLQLAGLCVPAHGSSACAENASEREGHQVERLSTACAGEGVMPLDGSDANDDGVTGAGQHCSPRQGGVKGRLLACAAPP